MAVLSSEMYCPKPCFKVGHTLEYGAVKVSSKLPVEPGTVRRTEWRPG